MSKPDKVLFGSGYHYITGIVVAGAGLLASLLIGFNVESLLLVIFSGLSATAFVYLVIVRQLNRLVKLIRSGERKPAAELEGQFHELYGFYRNLSLQVEQERNYYEKLYRDYSELLNTLNIPLLMVTHDEQDRQALKAEVLRLGHVDGRSVCLPEGLVDSLRAMRSETG